MPEGRLPTETRPLRAGARLIRVALAVAFGLPALGGGLGAQEARAPARVEAGVGATALHGSLAPIGSAGLLFALSERISIGGVGAFALNGTRLPGNSPAEDLELTVGWGGFAGEVRLAASGDRRLWLRLVAGAGTARVDLALVGTRIGSDNFGVLVPELGGGLQVRGPIHLAAAFGYRLPIGVEDLPATSGEDLRGVVGRLQLSVRIP